jgi:hypothetical protein
VVEFVESLLVGEVLFDEGLLLLRVELLALFEETLVKGLQK